MKVGPLADPRKGKPGVCGPRLHSQHTSESAVASGERLERGMGYMT